MVKALLWVRCWTFNSENKCVFELSHLNATAGVPACVLGEGLTSTNLAEKGMQWCYENFSKKFPAISWIRKSAGCLTPKLKIVHFHKVTEQIFCSCKSWQIMRSNVAYSYYLQESSVFIVALRICDLLNFRLPRSWRKRSYHFWAECIWWFILMAIV